MQHPDDVPEDVLKHEVIADDKKNHQHSNNTIVRIETDARFVAPLDRAIIVSILHLLHPIQMDDAMANFTADERLATRNYVASQQDRFLSPEAAEMIKPQIGI